ncbi:MAG: methoxymalonate biosynthesis acyl carrier protein [Pseudohongiellaceae bacterium]|jgi:methoxymalonate biosynthesis acyl carrier protein
MSVVAQIRDLLENEKDFKFHAEMSNDESLIEQGVVDSFGMITFVVLLEKAFGITVEPEDMSQDGFRSVTTIAGYVEGKLNGGDRG